MSGTDPSLDPEWRVGGPTGSNALADMTTTLKASEIVIPRVPAHLESRLLTTEAGWAWGTEPSFSPFSAYFYFNRNSPELAALFHPDHDDLWMWAHRGHGMNSYGAGLIARIGPIVIFQQTAYGGVFMDSAKAHADLNAANRAWNETLTSVEGLVGPPRVAVLWSDYRGSASISVSPEVLADNDSVDFDNAGGNSPFDGWQVLVSGDLADLGSLLAQHIVKDELAVSIAASHLFALVASKLETSPSDDATTNTPRGISHEAEESEQSPDTGDEEISTDHLEQRPGLINRVRTSIGSATYGPQLGDWSVSLDPRSATFLIQRTEPARAPRGAEDFDRGGDLQIRGWKTKSKNKDELGEVYVQQVQFSLESLCSYSDVRWISDEVLHGWEGMLIRARELSRTETITTKGKDLFDWDASRKPRELPLDMNAGQMASPNAPTDSPEEPERVVLSVDDLVESILAIGKAPSSALRDYFKERVSLLRLELGAATGELGHAEWLFNESVFNDSFGDPFTDQRVLEIPGLEAPAWLGGPYHELHDRIADLVDRADQLQTEIGKLRHAWLRSALVRAEPALEFRQTTEQRLQQRGLGPQPAPPIVEFLYDEDDW